MIQSIIFLLSLAIAALVFSKKYRLIPLYMFIVFLFTLDYANYYFKIDSSFSGYLIKTYAEILFIFTAAHFATQQLKTKKTKKIIVFAFIFIALTLAIGITKNGALNALLDWRSSILPIALPLLLSYSKIVNLDTARKLMGFVCLLTLLNTALAIFQYTTFNGDPQSSWRYDFLVDARQNNESDTEDRFVTYQIVREDKLRASGIFVSALQYSYLAAMSAFYIFLQITIVRKNKFVFYSGYSLLFMILIGGILASQVRASLIMLAISIISYLFCTSRSSTRISFFTKRAFALIFASYTALLVVLFKFGADSLDASAAGRAPQYLKAISDFSLLGAGLGKYRGQFDSDIVYGIITFGIAFVLIPLMFVTLFRKAFNKQANYSDGNSVILILAFCITTSAATVTLFQHLSGTIYYYMAWLLLITSANRESNNTSNPIKQRGQPIACNP